MKFYTMKHIGLWTILLSLIAGCSTTDIPQGEKTREGRPDQESWDVIISLTNEGALRAKVHAGHLEKFNDRYYTVLDDSVTVDFFNDLEQHTTWMTAKWAEINEQTDYMHAVGQVVVKSDSGVVLYTDTLSWDHGLELIYTDDSVMVTTEQSDTLYGIGFESDVRMEHWKITNPSGVSNRETDKE